MSATITTEHGTYTGKTVESIVRREYGRTAHIVWSADRNAIDAGVIVRGTVGQDGATVLARLRNADGEREYTEAERDEIAERAEAAAAWEAGR